MLSSWWRRVVEAALEQAAHVRARPIDLAAPLLLVDLYWAFDSAPHFRALAELPNYAGAILKATESTSYHKASWFVDQWKRLRFAAEGRYGTSWFRGAYHYLRFNRDGATQADYFLRTVDHAGGWAQGDLLPIVDVERGQPDSSNHQASAAQVVDVTSSYIARIRQITGRDVILYGRGAMRDLHIRDRMGARYLWNPSYTRTMPREPIERIGWTLADVPLWQYTDGRVCKAVTTRGTRLPCVATGFGATMHSVFLWPGGTEEFRRKLCAPTKLEIA